MLTGWKYWFVRYFGWSPLQPCRMCRKWFWGGLPLNGWRAGYMEYCSQECHDEEEEIPW
jgi:hypothetical protein